MKRKIAFCLFGILFICVGFSVIAETPVMALDDTSEQHAENITNILKNNCFLYTKISPLRPL